MSVARLDTARAEDIVGQVRRQLRREALFPMRTNAVCLYSGPPRVWSSGGPNSHENGNGSEELADRLRELYRSLDDRFANSSSGIGEMPAVAHTLRGKVGSIAINILRRLMWWYTRSLKDFAGSVGAHLQASTETIEVLSTMVRTQQFEIASLREEVLILRENQVERSENAR